MDDSDEPERPGTSSLIHGTAARDQSSSDRQAKQVNDPSNECCAEAGHRDHQSILLAEKRREEELPSTSHVGAGETQRLIRI